VDSGYGGSFEDWKDDSGPKGGGGGMNGYAGMTGMDADAARVNDGKMSATSYGNKYGTLVYDANWGTLTSDLVIDLGGGEMNKKGERGVWLDFASGEGSSTKIRDKTYLLGQTIVLSKFVRFNNSPGGATDRMNAEAMLAGIGPGISSDEFRNLADGILLTAEGFLLREERSIEAFLRSPASKGQRHFYKMV